jgi:dTDP-glucose 4,6-dehydratase
MDNKRILMTGGLGFIGSNFVNYLIDNYDEFKLINFDFGGVGSNLDNIKEPKSDKQEIHHVKWDISNDIIKNREWVDLPFDYLFHFAAESHVDRSIDTPEPFVRSNVMGTMQMLELARKIGVKRFVNVSTDEVVGSVKRAANEKKPYNPSSVYSASKASAEMMCNAYKVTYGLDIVTTRCGNNYGPNQYEEKLIPKVITNALTDQDIPIYDEGKQIREWCFVNDHIEDVIYVAENGESGETYNVGFGFPLTNIKLVNKILKYLNKKPKDLVKFKPNARLGHDFKYSLDITKLQRLKESNGDPVWGDISEEYLDNHIKDTVDYYHEKLNN